LLDVFISPALRALNSKETLMAKIDLRPMSLGEILDRTFSLYKSNFWLFTGIIAIPYLIIVIAGLFDVLVLRSTATTAAQGGLSPAAFGRLFFDVFATAILAFLIYLFVFAAAQAATVVAVSDLYLGRPASIHESFRRIRGKLLTVLLVIIITFLLFFAGSIFFLIPGIILLCRTAVAVPVATLEDTSASESVSRSMRLTKGSALQIFAVFVLLFTLSIVAAMIFQFPFYFAAGSPFKPHAVSLTITILTQLSSWVASVLVAPIGTIAFALIYYDLRIRKEAFDLEQLMGALQPGSSPAAEAGAGSPA
jgi:hypothetical protein